MKREAVDLTTKNRIRLTSALVGLLAVVAIVGLGHLQLRLSLIGPAVLFGWTQIGGL